MRACPRSNRRNCGLPTPRDVIELPAEGSGRYAATDDADLQAAWPSAAWHVQGPPSIMVRCMCGRLCRSTPVLTAGLHCTQ